MNNLQRIIQSREIPIRRKVSKIAKLPLKYLGKNIMSVCSQNFNLFKVEETLFNLMDKRMKKFHCPFGNEEHQVESIPKSLLEKYVPTEDASFELENRVIRRKNYSVMQLTVKERGTYKTRLIYFEQNKKGRFPTVMIFPIYEKDEIVSYFLSNYFSNNGFNSLIVHNPMEIYDENAFCENIESKLERLISRNMQIAEWLLSREKVDSERLCGFGASFGGEVLSMLAGVEKRLKYNVIALAGAPLVELFVNSVEKGISKKMSRLRQSSKLSAEEIRQKLTNEIETDPIYLARYINPKNSLFIGTAYDNIVPKAAQDRLWEAMGKPERLILPTDHKGAAVYLPYLITFTRKFYEGKLKNGF